MYVLGFIKSNDPNDVHNVSVLSYVVGLYICSCLCRETLPVTVNNLGHKRNNFIVGLTLLVSMSDTYLSRTHCMFVCDCMRTLTSLNHLG